MHFPYTHQTQLVSMSTQCPFIQEKGMCGSWGSDQYTGCPRKNALSECYRASSGQKPSVVIMIGISECARGSVRPFLSRGRSVAFWKCVFFWDTLYILYTVYYKPARSAKILSQDPLQPLSPSHPSGHTWAHESFGSYTFFMLIFLKSPHLHIFNLNLIFTFKYF